MGMFFSLETYAFLPGISILLTVCLVLLVSAFLKNKANRLIYCMTQLSLGVALFFLFKQMSFFQEAVVLAKAHVRIDAFSMVGDCAILLLSMFSLSYARRELSRQHLPEGEYYALALCSVMGMLVMTSAYHFVTLYIALELMSFPLYILTAYYRGSHQGAEASLKYFVTGVLASGFLLYGLSLIYGATGTLSFVDLGVTLLNPQGINSLLLYTGLAFVMAGFAFKLGLAPFHMWLPDVYEAAPSSFLIFISGAPKVAVLMLLVRLLETAWMPVLSHWSSLMVCLAVLSIFVGNVAALTQKNIRRLLAYSSIGQMGFMFVGLTLANATSFSATLFYGLSYALVSVGTFAVLAALKERGEVIRVVSDLKGLSQRYPGLSFIFLLFIFSMAGIPPLLGFTAKLSIMLALVEAHHMQMAIFMALMSVLAVYYYLSLIKAMYFDAAPNSRALSASSHAPIVLLSLVGLGVLCLGLYPAPLLQLCRWMLA